MGERSGKPKEKKRAKANRTLYKILNKMSNNRTSIPDSTSHRQLHDEPDKQHSHEPAKSKQPSKKNRHHSPHEECDIIGQIIGKYGKYQFFMTFLLSLFQIPNTFHISSPIYQVFMPIYHVSSCTCRTHFPISIISISLSSKHKHLRFWFYTSSSPSPIDQHSIDIIRKLLV